MGHGHDHAPARYDRSFAIGIALNVAFVGVELAFGIVADSLALIADAGHNLSDVLGLLLAWGAFRLAQRAPSRRYTYGLRRATILAALLSAVILLVALGAIAWEALGRFGSPPDVQSETMLVVGAVGVVVNTLTALLFVRDRDKDLNIRGAFLHMAADAAISLAVVVAGVAILATGWSRIDPALSLAIVAAILFWAWGLLRDSVGLSLDAVPKGIDLEQVDAWLRAKPGVADVHDLHVWAMSTTETALTAHLIMPDGDSDGFLQQLAAELDDRFHIHHSTVQIERAPSHGECRQAPSDVV